MKQTSTPHWRYPELLVRQKSEIRNQKSEMSFTLMELITVMAIIALLAGLLFPAVTAAIRKAKEGRALIKINQLVTAFRAYYNEYSVYTLSNNPSCLTNGYTWAMTLTAGDISNNPRRIVFLEFKEAEWIQKAGGANVTNLYDPWGQRFQIAFDTNYDNAIDISSTNTIPATARTNNSAFLIWSYGDPKRATVLSSWQ